MAKDHNVTRNKVIEDRYKWHHGAYKIIAQAFNEYANSGKKEREEKPMKFSIVFPTRERPHLIKALLESIDKNTFNLEDIEVLVAVDNDDILTFDFILSLNYSFVKPLKVVRSLNFSRDYYTFLAKQSSGKWIICANDDCVMETPEWDRIAYEVLKEKSGVVYGWIQDGLGTYRAHGHGNYCCFPLQGRAGFEALGYIFPSRIPTWGADIWCKNLYDQVGSVVEIPITLRHHCHHNRTRPQDHISLRIAHNQVPFDMRVNYDEINKLLDAQKKEMVKL